jgi:peptide/nickel transport system permease protein
MAELILKRTGLAVLTLLLVSVLVFAGTEILPGDVATAMLGTSASPATLEAVRQALGLHDPVVVRYGSWLAGILTGHIGMSMANGAPIGPELWVRLDNTMFLAGVAACITVPLALALGIATALWRGSYFDRLINVFGITAISLPEFFIAYLLILFFAVNWAIFPGIATVTPDMPLIDRLQTIALPALTLVLAVLAYIMRMTRTAILSAMRHPYIEMALLKGVSPLRVVLLHALPTALAPIIQVVTFNLAYMVVGIVLVEVVFVYPGIGQYLVDAVSKRDVPVVQACGLVFGATYVGLNLIADILTIVVNPRLRHPS